MHFSTRAVHAGSEPDRDPRRGVSVPIDPSTTFYYERFEQLDAVAGGALGYMYARYTNPTVAALERAVAALEGAEAALAFASGMAALHAALLACGLTPGDVIVCAQELYGGTIGLLMNVLAPLGLDLRFADLNQPGALDAALAGPGVRALLIESMSNPLLRVPDIAQMAEKAHAAGARLLVDATFTSPVLLRALELGADFSIHSATKYLGGHGDVLGGVVACREADRATLDSYRKLVGGVLGPFEAWLVLRGIKTLPLRMERQCANAARVADFLRAHPAVERVHYPGFGDHPDHAAVARQFGGPGGTPGGAIGGAMVSFELRGAGRDQVFAFINRLQLILPCTSLGDVQSLLLYPIVASHRDIAPKQRQRMGIRDNLVRLSCGIEAADDLIADLNQALAAK